MKKFLLILMFFGLNAGMAMESLNQNENKPVISEQHNFRENMLRHINKFNDFEREYWRYNEREKAATFSNAQERQFYEIQIKAIQEENELHQQKEESLVKEKSASLCAFRFLTSFCATLHDLTKKHYEREANKIFAQQEIYKLKYLIQESFRELTLSKELTSNFLLIFSKLPISWNEKLPTYKELKEERNSVAFIKDFEYYTESLKYYENDWEKLQGIYEEGLLKKDFTFKLEDYQNAKMLSEIIGFDLKEIDLFLSKEVEEYIEKEEVRKEKIKKRKMRQKKIKQNHL